MSFFGRQILLPTRKVELQILNSLAFPVLRPRLFAVWQEADGMAFLEGNWQLLRVQVSCCRISSVVDSFVLQSLK